VEDRAARDARGGVLAPLVAQRRDQGRAPVPVDEEAAEEGPAAIRPAGPDLEQRDMRDRNAVDRLDEGLVLLARDVVGPAADLQLALRVDLVPPVEVGADEDRVGGGDVLLGGKTEEAGPLLGLCEVQVAEGDAAAGALALADQVVESRREAVDLVVG